MQSTRENSSSKNTRGKNIKSFERDQARRRKKGKIKERRTKTEVIEAQIDKLSLQDMGCKSVSKSWNSINQDTSAVKLIGNTWAKSDDSISCESVPIESSNDATITDEKSEKALKSFFQKSNALSKSKVFNSIKAQLKELLLKGRVDLGQKKKPRTKILKEKSSQLLWIPTSYIDDIILYNSGNITGSHGGIGQWKLCIARALADFLQSSGKIYVHDKTLNESDRIALKSLMFEEVGDFIWSDISLETKTLLVIPQKKIQLKFIENILEQIWNPWKLNSLVILSPQISKLAEESPDKYPLCHKLLPYTLEKCLEIPTIDTNVTATNSKSKYDPKKNLANRQIANILGSIALHVFPLAYTHQMEEWSLDDLSTPTTE